MTDIALFGGPLKKTLILRAYGLCGQSVTEFELTPEEYEQGLVCMNDVAGSLVGMPFNLPLTGNGYAEEESGLAASDQLGFIARLAQELGPNIGKQFMPNGRQSSAITALVSKYQVIPSMQLARNTIRGAGNRYRSISGPFFYAPVSDDEIVQ